MARITGIAAGAVCVAGAVFAVPPDPPPAETEAPVRRIVEQALDRGSRVIVKRVDYRDGEGGEAPGVPEAPVRSRTYIEIDTRPPGAAGDRELLESQVRIEERQREIGDSVEAIAAGQERAAVTLRSIERLGHDVSGGMGRAAAEADALRGSAAGAAVHAGETAEAVAETDTILRQIEIEARELSGSIDALSDRIGREGRRAGVRAPPILGDAAKGSAFRFEGDGGTGR